MALHITFWSLHCSSVFKSCPIDRRYTSTTPVLRKGVYMLTGLTARFHNIGATYLSGQKCQNTKFRIRFGYKCCFSNLIPGDVYETDVLPWFSVPVSEKSDLFEKALRSVVWNAVIGMVYPWLLRRYNNFNATSQRLLPVLFNTKIHSRDHKW